MKKITLLYVFWLIAFACNSQTATFITLNSGGSFSKVTVSPSGCTSTTLNLCSNFTGSPLSIALDSNILYIVDNKGWLYKNILTGTGTVGNCTKLGQFAHATTGYYGLTVGAGGIVYAAYGGDIESYNPASNTFSILGTLPNGWAVGGDMLFYKGNLYEAATASGNNILVQVNLANITASSLYMTFNAGTNVFGFASVTMPCSENETYALSTTGSSTDIYAVDMVNKTQATTAKCSLPFKVNDAASIAETKSNNIVKNDTLNLFDCDSVYYKGAWYNYPTTIYDTLKSVYGCDSVDLVVHVTLENSKRDYAYVSSTKSNNVSVINVSTNTVVATIPVGLWPVGVSASGDGTKVYVANLNSNTLSVISTLTNTVIATVPVGLYPAGVSVNPNGGNIYVSNQVSNDVSVINSNTNSLIATIKVGKSPNGLVVSPDGLKVYVANRLSDSISVISTSTNQVIATISVGVNPGLIAISPDGVKVFVSNTGSSSISVINTLNNIVIATIPVKNSPFGVSVSPNGKRTYVANSSSNTLTVIDVAVDTVITTINVGQYPDGVSVSSDNRFVYVTNINSNDVTVVNALTNIVEATIPVGIGPTSYGNFIANVPVKKTLKDTLNFSSCSSITYKTKTYTNSTSFTDTTKNYRGCDSIYTLVNITITSNIKKDTLNQFRACNQLIYKSNTYTSSSIILDSILKKVNGCDSIYRYTQIIITPIAPITQAINLSGCSSVIYKGNTYATSVVVKDTVKSYQGCDSIYNITNIVITPITPIANTINLNHCRQIVYNSITYTTSTVLKDTIKSYQGCDSIYNIVNITINPISTTISNINLNDCKQVIYKGNTFTASTNLIDTVKSYQGCDSVYVAVTITIKPITTVINSVSFNHCSHIVYKTITYYSSTVLKDTLRNSNGCDSIYNIVNITINPLSTTTTATTYGSCDSLVANGITYYNSVSTTDTLKSYQGCDSVYRLLNIHIFPKPTVRFSPPIIYTQTNASIILTPITTNTNSYLWLPPLYLDDTMSPNPICTPADDITYKLKVVSDSGCVETGAVKIFLEKPIEIPTAFSPNGDGFNDNWDIKFINTYTKNSVLVFTRSGQLMYTSASGNYKPWDGKHNGKDMPAGVYYYIIKLTPASAPVSGSVTILR